MLNVFNKLYANVRNIFFGTIFDFQRIMKRISVILLVFLILFSCQSQEIKKAYKIEISDLKDTLENKILAFKLLHSDSAKKSISLGSVSNGSLKNGKLMPFEGENFFYFDTTSYLEGRAFVNQKVKSLCLETYHELKTTLPKRKFGIMECSHERGGELSPHITHQNGLSVDFMTPMKSNGTANYTLDYIGLQHYFLDFDTDGKYLNDRSIEIDFDAMSLHVLKLNELAKAQGLKIDKILFKTDLNDNLFASKYGPELKVSGIYFAQKLPMHIDNLHDDHYHIDFKSLD